MTHFEEDRMQQNIDTIKTEWHQYDAFISYSHKADSELAKVLQVRLERWARPWFAARTAKLFRDQVSLTATPHLWTTIAASLDNSEYLILLASTDSAKSEWVPKEVCYWVTGGKSDDPKGFQSNQVIKDRVDRLMIVLTEGQIEWSHAEEDFDWSLTSALHPVLRKLPWQPLWSDLRWARGMKATKIETDERFTEPVLKLLSPIRGKSPQELLDANDKEQKKAVTLFRRLTIGLAIGFILAAAGGFVASQQRDLAIRREREARHEQGVGWLARSESAERRRDYLASKLMAMKAVNFSGYGEATVKGQELLKSETEEYRAALRQIASIPECNLIYTTQLDLDPGHPKSECTFNNNGTQLTTASANGASTKVDFVGGTIQHSKLTKPQLDELSRTFDRFPHLQNEERRPISSGGFLKITIDQNDAFTEWSDADERIAVTRQAVPEEALQYGENNDYPELVDLTISRLGHTAVATFQNRYVQSVVICQRPGCSVLYNKHGEMSGDSGVLHGVGVCISPDEAMIAVSESNGKDDSGNCLRIYQRNPAGMYALQRNIIVEGAAVNKPTISPRNQYLAGSAGNLIHIWDMVDGRLVLTLSGHDNAPADIEFSQDERTLASVATDGLILVWSLPLMQDEEVSLRGLDSRLYQSLFQTEIPKANPDLADQDKVLCTSPSGDLKAEWETYWSAAGLGDETRYATLKVVDPMADATIGAWVMVDAQKIDSLQFTGDGLAIIANVPDGAPLLFPISHPRHQINYKSAYAPVKYVSDGIELQRSSPSWREGRLAVPATLSTIMIAEKVPRDLIEQALKWHAERFQISIPNQK
ncbi:MAG: TIR domain-containing protein [Planctomycetaceae bacterium]